MREIQSEQNPWNRGLTNLLRRQPERREQRPVYDAYVFGGGGAPTHFGRAGRAVFAAGVQRAHLPAVRQLPRPNHPRLRRGTIQTQRIPSPRKP